VNTRISFSSRLPARLRRRFEPIWDKHRLAKAVPILETKSAVLGQGLKKSSLLKYGQVKPFAGRAEEIIHD